MRERSRGYTSPQPPNIIFLLPMDVATAKFAQALPFALAPVSTQLAALHTVRSQQPYSCTRCGSQLALRVRSGRQSRGSARAISTTCLVCGGVSNTTVQEGNAAASFPSRKRRRVAEAELDLSQSKVQEQLLRAPAPAIETPSPSSPTITHPAQTSQIKSKKKSGLQEMLQRNREKEKKRTQTDQATPAGLSAFLSTL